MSQNSNITISELTSEISRLRDLILYCENKILRKEIAVQEILHMKDAKDISVEEILSETKHEIEFK
jgi:hypothetical protein